MLSNKPYLIRAFYDWIVDSQCTPFLLADATLPRCKVPEQFVEEGRITLNLAPEAIRDLNINANFLEFRASFSGVVYIISIPIAGVLAIYAKENQQGMFFESEGEGETELEGTVAWSQEQTSDNNVEQSHLKSEMPHLRLVD